MVGYNGQHIPDWPGQQPWQDQAYQNFIRGQVQRGGLPAAQMAPGNQAAQPLTPPTIRADIIQIENEGWETTVDRYPLAAGASQMFITRAEDKIIVKTMGQSGPLPLDVYRKQPPAPPAPVFDPSEYVRKDELQDIIAAAVEAQGTTKRTPRKEAAEE